MNASPEDSNSMLDSTPRATKIGLIVGAVLGAVALIILVAVVYFCRRTPSTIEESKEVPDDDIESGKRIQDYLRSSTPTVHAGSQLYLHYPDEPTPTSERPLISHPMPLTPTTPTSPTTPRGRPRQGSTSSSMREQEGRQPFYTLRRLRTAEDEPAITPLMIIQRNEESNAALSLMNGMETLEKDRRRSVSRTRPRSSSVIQPGEVRKGDEGYEDAQLFAPATPSSGRTSPSSVKGKERSVRKHEVKGPRPMSVSSKGSRRQSAP